MESGIAATSLCSANPAEVPTPSHAVASPHFPPLILNVKPWSGKRHCSAAKFRSRRWLGLLAQGFSYGSTPHRRTFCRRSLSSCMRDARCQQSRPSLALQKLNLWLDELDDLASRCVRFATRSDRSAVSGRLDLTHATRMDHPSLRYFEACRCLNSQISEAGASYTHSVAVHTTFGSSNGLCRAANWPPMRAEL